MNELPSWTLKLVRRLMALSEGRWQIIVTVGKGYRDWTVLELGKVEADHQWNKEKENA